MQFSIIIPSARPTLVLAETLRALQKQTLGQHQFEVIVVRNQVAETDQVLLKSLGFTASQLKIIHSKTAQGPSTARNIGFQQASYDKVIFIDDDCSIQTDFLAEYAKAWQKFPAATVIGGPVLAKTSRLTAVKKTLLELHAWCFGLVEYGSVARTVDGGETLFSANLSVSKTALKKLGISGPFYPQLGTRLDSHTIIYGEDWEFCLRVLCMQGIIYYVPSCKVWNMVGDERFTWRYLFRRYWLAGLERIIVEKHLQQLFGKTIQSLFQEQIWVWSERLKKNDFWHWISWQLLILESGRLVNYQLRKINQMRYTTLRL